LKFCGSLVLKSIKRSVIVIGSARGGTGATWLGPPANPEPLNLEPLNGYHFFMFSLNDYSYQLPADLIAQRPADQRDRSNLLCLKRETGKILHHRFNQIGDFLQPGDVLVINNTAVIPARLEGRKATGGN
jgi:hypothetical protein